MTYEKPAITKQAVTGMMRIYTVICICEKAIDQDCPCDPN